MFKDDCCVPNIPLSPVMDSHIELITEDRAKVQVSRASLKILGPHFATILERECVKATPKSPIAQLKLLIANRDTLTLLQDYLINQPVRLEPLFVWRTIAFSKYYQIDRLLDECYGYLLGRVSLHNCFALWTEASTLSNPNSTLNRASQLATKVDQFILYHFEELLASEADGLLHLTADHLLRLLSHPQLAIATEADVWKAIERWTAADLSSRLQHLPALLGTLRYGRLTEAYLQKTILSSPLLKDNEKCLILVQEMIQQNQVLRSGSWNDPLGQSNIQTVACRPRVPREVIILFGGWTNNETPSSALEVFDYQARTWIHHRLPDSFRIAYCGLQWLGGALYIIGGTDGLNHETSLYRFDPANPCSRSVTKLCPMSEARCFVASVALNGQIYALGGHNGEARVDTCERYDPGTNRWSRIASMNVVRSDASATVHRGRVYIAGGVNPGGVDNSVEVYNPQTDTWTMLPPMTSPRSSLGLVTYHGALYAIGGNTGYERLKSVETYNFKTKVWSEIASMTTERSTFKAAVFRDQIYAINGYGERTLQSVEVYSGKTGIWRSLLSKTTRPRSGFGVTVASGLPNMELYTFNGAKKREEGCHTSKSTIKQDN